MASNIQKMDLVGIDLNQGTVYRSWHNHAIGMKDNKGDAFGILVYRDKEPVDLTGISVQGYYKNPQGTNIAITTGNTVEGNMAYVVLPQACYDYDGQFTLAIKLIGGGITGTMRIVDGMVNNTNVDGAVAPTGTVPTYQEVLSVFEQMQGALEEYDEKVTEQDGKIDDLKSALKPDASIWANVGLASATGLPSISEIRVATLFVDRNIEKTIIATEGKCAVLCWGADGEYIGVYTGNGYSKTGLTWFETEVDLTAIDKTYQIRILCAFANNANISPENASNMILFRYGADKTDVFATPHVNILEDMPQRTGYYYDGLTQKTNSDFSAYQLVPLKAGVTYYYRNIYGALSTIRCDYNNTAVTLSGNSGSITPTYDSYLAITVLPTQNPLLTTSQAMYDSLDTETKYVANKILTGIGNDNLISGANIWAGDWSNASSWVTDSEMFRDLIVKKRTGAWNGLHKPVYVEAGKHYHFTAYYKVSSPVAVQIALTQTVSTASVYTWDEKGYTQVQNISTRTVSNRANKWRKVNVEFECTESGFINPTIQAQTSTTLYVCGFTIAEGYNQERPVFTCTKDGNGDFDALTEAILFGTMFFDSTVFVGDGDWDVIDELGTAYMESVSPSKRGPYIKNRIRLVFSSNSRVLANYEGTNQDTMLWFAPFNSAKYGFTLENANIQCSNVRYAVHDERNAEDDEYTNYYLNCKMYLDNTNNTATAAHQCIGGGLGLNGHIVIDGGDYQSVFPSQKPASGYRPISYHNSSGIGRSRIDIKNVYIHEGGIRLNYYGQSPASNPSECFVSGCSFTEDILSGRETTDGSSPYVNLIVTQWNNQIRSN